MKKATICILLALTVVGAGFAQAPKLGEPSQVFLDRFINTGTKNKDFSEFGGKSWSAWGSTLGARGTITNSSPGVVGGVTPDMGAEINFNAEDHGAVYTYCGQSFRALIKANQKVDRTTREIVSIDFYIKEYASFDAFDSFQVAVQVKGQWYISATAFYQEKVQADVYTPRQLDWAKDNLWWVLKNADSKDVAMTPDFKPGMVKLPDGDLDNFGMFESGLPNHAPLFDEYSVTSAPRL